MAENEDCGMTAIERSRCIMEAILDDVVATYGFPNGGGISRIEQDSTWVFTVSLPQEGRIDMLTYKVELDDDGGVKIVNRTETSRDP
ncbi:MAG: hypothetical protein AAGD13_22560 [Pseudomonadota bacterium]